MGAAVVMSGGIYDRAKDIVEKIVFVFVCRDKVRQSMLTFVIGYGVGYHRDRTSGSTPSRSTGSYEPPHGHLR